VIIVLQEQATERDVDAIIRIVREAGLETNVSFGSSRTVIGVIGDPQFLNVARLREVAGVDRVIWITHPYKLADKRGSSGASEVTVGDVTFGGNTLVMIAGPCAVESEEQLLSTAEYVKKAGARVLRGGAFKPRTSPYSFQGLGEPGLKLLARARESTGLLIATEVVGEGEVPLVAEYADIIQIGARNMQNFRLLETVGRTGKPVILKRGFGNTVEETLLSAEYILSQDNRNVILCERGIRTFENYTRNTLDVMSVPTFKSHSHLPVIVDPSHSTGRRDLVVYAARAAVAVGADGLLVETHPSPETAQSDGYQAVLPEQFATLAIEVERVARAVGRTFGIPLVDDRRSPAAQSPSPHSQRLR
jgi:3-deoxy-7-phosphoheptulonate synthase